MTSKLDYEAILKFMVIALKYYIFHDGVMENSFQNVRL